MWDTDMFTPDRTITMPSGSHILRGGRASERRGSMRRISCSLLALCGLGFSIALHAQAAAAAKTIITVKLRDGKTGQSVDVSNVNVRFNHQSEAGGNWVDQKDDGSIEVTLPHDAKVIAIRTTYMNSLEYYVNCDVAKQKNVDAETWYPVADILAGGLAIPNDCVRPKDADKVKIDPKPGELILFVRKRNWKEQAME